MRAPQRPNLFIKIPGTPEGVPAIEESIFAGVPVNVTLLFSREQYRRCGARRTCAASSGASPPASTRKSVPSRRCSSAAGTWRSKDKVPASFRNRLGIAIARRAYKAYRELLASPRWRRLCRRRRPAATAAVGQHRHQGSGCARHALRRSAGGARTPINTMPEKTLHAFADHGEARTADAGRRRRRRDRARGIRTGGCRRSTRLPPSFSAKAPNRSTSRGRISGLHCIEEQGTATVDHTGAQ